jgi:hypothetical protein
MTKFMLPVGRIVQGGPTFRQDKDMQGRSIPNYFMAVACPKGDCQEVLHVISQATKPMNGFARVVEDEDLVWRVEAEDGDLPANQGKEGFAGCFIFKLNTFIGPMQCYDRECRPINPKLVKRGYFVQVVGTCVANTAGVYLDPDMVQMVCYGPEIMSDPTAAELPNYTIRHHPFIGHYIARVK